jgi:hypothetical protein
MVSSAILKKICTFFQFARESILLINNIHEKINPSQFFYKEKRQPLLSLLKTSKCLVFCIISAGNCCAVLVIFVIVSYFIANHKA